MKRLIVVMVWLLTSLGPTRALAFTVFLNGGEFFGPGITGVHPFVNGQLRNVTLTGPLTGFIPFFNNGPEPPNVIAEVLGGGVVDGRVSDGTLINENIDTALVLDINDPVTGESARMMVVAVAGPTPDGSELVQSDARGNLFFKPSVVADPGSPDLVVPFTVVFSTGALEIPLSLKTQQGLPGGHDQAGPFPSGRVLIGRLGDFDQDGFLDGVLVLSGNGPLELVVARGDPIAQNRPWTSDIPVTPLDAALLTLNGVVQNFPEPLQKTFRTGEIEVALGYLADIGGRLDAALENLQRALRGPDLEKGPEHLAKWARKFVREAGESIRDGVEAIEKGESAEGARRIREGFGLTGAALQLLAAARSGVER